VMAAVAIWCRVVFVSPSGTETATYPFGGPGLPDLAAVDALARAQLCASRLGGSIRLRDVCEALEELLDLAGLRREMRGEPESGEEVGVQKGVEAGDPVA
jgi:hypothetical protein